MRRNLKAIVTQNGLEIFFTSNYIGITFVFLKKVQKYSQITCCQKLFVHGLFYVGTWYFVDHSPLAICDDV